MNETKPVTSRKSSYKLMEKIIIKAADGYPLSALFGRPEGIVMGVIVISSATCVKKEFYINFAHFPPM